MKISPQEHDGGREGGREEVKEGEKKNGLSGMEGKLSESDEKRIHDMKYLNEGLVTSSRFLPSLPPSPLPPSLPHPLPYPAECINPFQGWVITGKKRDLSTERHSGYYQATFVDISFHN